MNSYTSWKEFSDWARKYGWIQIRFMLHSDKTATALFVLPSGRFCSVSIADDVNNIMAVMECRVTNG
jgi:hypothetical protein